MAQLQDRCLAVVLMGLYQTGTVNRIYSANNRQQIYLISNQKVLRNGGTAAGGFFLFLKGVRHKIFDLHFIMFFHPSRPLIKRLKYFLIQFLISPGYSIIKLEKLDSAVCMTPQSPNCRISKSIFFFNSFLS